MQHTAIKVGASSDLYSEVIDWLHTEAELLDGDREREWLEGMVSEDVVYQVPLRQTVERARGTGFADRAYHLDERYGSLASRVARNETSFAWAEDPPSRIRHFVSNVRVRQLDDGCLDVRSNLLVYRTRQDQTQPQLLSAERQDVLRREDGALMLRARLVLLDLTVIATHNLSIFF
ncbi:aromatic-ring-hydroxylating dioxygenase subunit beta [Streptomyces sp. NBC_00145]|uniref:aromatic-ring-hydroxylating dioxygenase subunit beta n=1 Tax=Streptomyces sp. NBC_00145 TaxID=2975666 RepID=UPI002E19E215